VLVEAGVRAVENSERADQDDEQEDHECCHDSSMPHLLY
jgi:hypothetical protein